MIRMLNQSIVEEGITHIEYAIQAIEKNDCRFVEMYGYVYGTKSKDIILFHLKDTLNYYLKQSELNQT